MSILTTAPVTSLAPSLAISPGRVAGWAGLAFAGGVVAANSLLFGMPTPDVPAGDAAGWFEANRVRAMFGSSMVAITFPALLIFGASMFAIGREVPAARIWMTVGALGSAAMAGVFSIVAAGQIGAILFASTGGEAFAAAWVIHNAAFAVNMSVLGTAFLGFALGAHAVGIIPSGLRTAGVVGAVLLLATGFANAAVAGGSAMVFVGLVGFLLWLFWLIATSLRLVRLPSRLPADMAVQAG